MCPNTSSEKRIFHKSELLRAKFVREVPGGVIKCWIEMKHKDGTRSWMAMDTEDTSFLTKESVSLSLNTTVSDELTEMKVQDIEVPRLILFVLPLFIRLLFILHSSSICPPFILYSFSTHPLCTFGPRSAVIPLQFSLYSTMFCVLLVQVVPSDLWDGSQRQTSRGRSWVLHFTIV
jgi:hypothetical protein